MEGAEGIKSNICTLHIEVIQIAHSLGLSWIST